MAEYIKREAAYEDFEKCNSENPKWTPSRVKSLIARQKAADVAQVQHGRWVHTDLAAHWYGKDECSECTYHEHDRRDLSHFNYCPNCGAKMDLEV